MKQFLIQEKIYSWRKFLNYHQEIGQSFDDYMAELRKLNWY